MNYLKTITKILLLTLTACGSSTYDTSYDTRHYKDQAEDYRIRLEKTIDSSFESFKWIRDINNKIISINEKTSEVLRKTEALDLNLSSNAKSAATLAQLYMDIHGSVSDILSEIDTLEGHLSTKMKSVQHLNINNAVISTDRSSAIKRADEASQALSSLSGLRNLYLKLLEDYNRQIKVYAEKNNQSEELNKEIESYSNPIVSDFQTGGVISGIVRDSVTGSGVPNVQIGFKKRLNDLRYFYVTHTDAQGSYQSNYLRPGSYIVEIQREGYVQTSRNEVTVERGHTTEENTSISKPIEAGQYRITISWGAMGYNKVRDVDSYLVIPGMRDPLSYRSVNRNYGGANLDRDDTDWIGPETITISDIKNGTYVYYVNNFSDRGRPTALGNSNIRIELYKGNEHIRSFTVPEGNGLSYEVFRIENGDFIYTETYNDNLSVH